MQTRRHFVNLGVGYASLTLPLHTVTVRIEDTKNNEAREFPVIRQLIATLERRARTHAADQPNQAADLPHPFAERILFVRWLSCILVTA